MTGDEARADDRIANLILRNATCVCPNGLHACREYHEITAALADARRDGEATGRATMLEQAMAEVRVERGQWQAHAQAIARRALDNAWDRIRALATRRDQL